MLHIHVAYTKRFYYLGKNHYMMNILILLLLLYIIVALRHLKKNSEISDELRQNAAGALWILEKKDQPENVPKSAEPGLYTFPLNIIESHLCDVPCR